MTKGVQTSEFWTTTIMGVIGLLTMLGWIVPSQQAHLAESILQVVGAAVAVIPSVTYILGRTWLKSKGGVVATQ